METVTIPILVAIVSAVLTASLTSSLQYRNSLKQDEKNLDFISVQQFIYPNLGEMISFVNGETNFRQDEVESIISKEEVVRRITDGMKYCNPSKCKALSYEVFRRKRYESFVDNRGNNLDTSMASLLFCFFEYYLDTIKCNSDIRGNDLHLEQVTEVKKKCGTLVLLTDRYGYELSSRVIACMFEVNWKAMPDISYDELQAYLDRRYDCDSIPAFKEIYRIIKSNKTVNEIVGDLDLDC